MTTNNTKEEKKMKRCNALNGDMKQCRKKSAITFDYFGDSELYHRYDKSVAQVRVNFCVDHFLATGGKFI